MLQNIINITEQGNIIFGYHVQYLNDSFVMLLTDINRFPASRRYCRLLNKQALIVQRLDLRFAPFGNKQLGSKRSHFLDGFSDLSEPNFG